MGLGSAQDTNHRALLFQQQWQSLRELAEG